MNSLWTTYKIERQQALEGDNSLPPNSISPSKRPQSGSLKNFLSLGQSLSEDNEVTDEYRAYCQLPVLKSTPHNLISWWRDQESSFPLLSTLAYTVLSIPAMSAECERVFSSSKLLITPARNRLSPATIESCECLRNWYLKKVID